MGLEEDAVALCADAPGAKTITASGESSRGPVNLERRLIRDASGDSVDVQARIMTIPAAHLPSLRTNGVVLVDDVEYKVQDIAPADGDELLKELTLVRKT